MRLRRRRERRLKATLIGLPVGLTAIGVGVGAALKRRSARAGAQRESFRCECGEKFRVAGRDRHRIYWHADAPEDSPQLDHTCPRCQRPLPQGTARETAETPMGVAGAPA